MFITTFITEKKMEEKENIMRSTKENFDKMFASYFQT